MYFDELEKQVLLLAEDKVRKTKEHEEEIREIEETLKGLEKSKNEALDQGDDESFVKIGGMIAVTESKLERVKHELAFVVPEETIIDTMDEINEEYRKEVGKRTNDIFKSCDKILKDIEEMQEIASEYFTIVHTLEETKGKVINENKYFDGSSLSDFLNYARKVINPTCDSPNAVGIRAKAFCFDYDPKKRQN